MKAVEGDGRTLWSLGDVGIANMAQKTKDGGDAEGLGSRQGEPTDRGDSDYEVVDEAMTDELFSLLLMERERVYLSF